MGRVLVTGANGHIGSRVVRAFVERGVEARVYVRPGSDRRALGSLPVEVVEGDLMDRARLERAARGVEILVHTAAPHRNFAADPDQILKPAVEGTASVLDAAAAAGVRRLVLTSSAATLGFAEDPARPVDEDHAPGAPRALYARAKIAQEALALAETRLEVVVLNPSGVLGAGDYRLTPATRALLGWLQGDPAFLAVSVTDVGDVGRAHALAAERGQPGRRYLITGDVLSPAQLSATLDGLLGFGPRVMVPPRLLLDGLAWWQERRARASGEDAGLTRDMVADVWGKHLAYDSGRSRRELGMSYRPAADVLHDAILWLLELGALRPRVAARVQERLTAGGSAA